jgi:ATP-binding cassette subfamily B protein RaxB
MALVDGLRTGWRRRLPVLLQTEAAECGLACLAMIASYHGHGVDVASLRRRFAVSLQGTTLAALMDFATRLGLATRAVRVELDDLKRLRRPCVLHWSFTHFVVLRRVTRRHATIHDPSRGVRRVSLAECGAAFTGVALELWPDAQFEQRARQPPVRVRDVLGRLEGVGAAITQISLLAFALEVFVLANPLLVQWVVDHALPTASVDLLTLLALGFGLAVVFEQATAAVRAWVIMHFETTLNVQWHANVFSHLLRLPLSYFEKRHLGDIVSRFRSIDAIQRAVTTASIEAVVDGAMAALLLVVMIWYSPLLTSVCTAATVLYAGSRALTHRPLREARDEQIAAAAKQESHFIETVRGVRAIKLFARGGERRSGWLALLVEQVNAGLRAQRLGVALKGGNGLLFGLENVVVIYLGARLVLDAQLSTGMLLAFLAYKRQFSLRVSALIDKVAELALLRLHCERLADVVQTAPEQALDAPARSVGVGRTAYGATIRVRGLKYRYAEHAPYVLDGVDLDVAAGECVAIVGPSGCGKSTLLQVLLGMRPPAAGEIAVGGAPLLALRGGEGGLASVLQNDCLFAGSIADNISFFDPQPNHARIEDCARISAIHDDVAALPMAYNTLVGFLGSALSAGQQQRILLARALYSRPSILILDEATSQLDVRCERVVCAALARLDMTRIIAAHRPETVAAADRIVRIERGRIVDNVPRRATGDRDRRQAGDTTLPSFALSTPSSEEQALLGNLGC